MLYFNPGTLQCGEIILWDDDCSQGHFKQIGREISRKAVEMWAGKKV